MNTAAHHVAPEDVMALLDGELSGAAAEAVSTHLAECGECAALGAQFRDTSLWFARWTVPAVPTQMESAISDLAADAAYERRNGGGGFRDLRPLTIGAVAIAAIFLVVYVGTRPVRRERMMAFASPSPLASPAAVMSRDRAASSVDARNAPDAIRLNSVDSSQVGLNASADQVATAAPLLQASSAPAAPMIARTANVIISVKDFAASRAALEKILAQRHGYFASLNVSTAEGSPHSLQASLRVPAPELTAALNDIKGIGWVLSESQSGEEVTQQHEDLVMRLQNARETEERFRGILQQRTGNLADVLAVEEGIARVRGEIERMEAEQKALEHRVDFASVEIQLSEEYKASMALPDDSVSTQLHNAFVSGYHRAAGTILGIVLFFEEYGPAIAIWLLMLALPVIGWRRYRRLRSRF
jgi:anti-sigma factor RsiW